MALEVVETWTSSVLPSEIARYKLRDILSISEFLGYFTNAMKLFFDVTCHGAKCSKCRLTVLLGQTWEILKMCLCL